jgi:hypothetical protein
MFLILLLCTAAFLFHIHLPYPLSILRAFIIQHLVINVTLAPTSMSLRIPPSSIPTGSYLTPFDLQGADASVGNMLCIGHGNYSLSFRDGTHATIHMYHCPKIAETLISPQAICT